MISEKKINLLYQTMELKKWFNPYENYSFEATDKNTIEIFVLRKFDPFMEPMYVPITKMDWNKNLQCWIEREGDCFDEQLKKLMDRRKNQIIHDKKLQSSVLSYKNNLN